MSDQDTLFAVEPVERNRKRISRGPLEARAWAAEEVRSLDLEQMEQIGGVDEAQAELFRSRKPPYSVPSLADALATPTVARAISTFSGCGGSSLGLRRAGFDVLHAVEFIPSARETYEANFPATPVDDRDIRLIDPLEILAEHGLRPGELDLLEGSPPCSSFSASNTGSTKYAEHHYSDGVHQRTDDLFDEWLRFVEAIEPRAAIAENVVGLWQGEGYAYLSSILEALMHMGYAVHARVLSAAAYGAATKRPRTIIQAVRRDVGEPRWPPGGFEPYTLGEAMATCPESPQDELDNADFGPGSTERGEFYSIYPFWLKLKPGSTVKGSRFNLGRAHWDRPLPTVTVTGMQAGSASVAHPDEPRKFTATEVAWVSGFPADFTFTGTPKQRYERVGRAVPPPLYEALGRSLVEVLA